MQASLQGPELAYMFSIPNGSWGEAARIGQGVLDPKSRDLIQVDLQVWNEEASGWAGQPARRICRHSPGVPSRRVEAHGQPLNPRSSKMSFLQLSPTLQRCLTRSGWEGGPR